MQFAVVGPGRAGTTIAARLDAAGLQTVLVRDRAGADAADVAILAVPDAAIRQLAATFADGVWLVHLSGATPLADLGAARRRAFVLHPLQTLRRDGGPRQLDGVPVTVTAASPAAMAFARDLGARLGLDLHELAEDARPLPHLAAVLAGNGPVTLIAEACRVLAAAGLARDEAAELLGPLVRTSVEQALVDAGNGVRVVPTGPAARGDAATVRRHRGAIARIGPRDLDGLYVSLARSTARLAGTGSGPLATALDALPPTISESA